MQGEYTLTDKQDNRHTLKRLEVSTGFNFEDPYTKQGIEKIATLMQELLDRSQTGTLIRSVAESFRLGIGLNGTLATIPWEKVKKYVTNTRYGYLADFFRNAMKELKEMHRNESI